MTERAQDNTAKQIGESMTNRIAEPTTQQEDPEVVTFESLQKGQPLQEPEAENTGTEATSETALPEKLQGKSIEQVAEMYQNLETRFGRQGNELGQLRQLTDSILKEKTVAPEPEKTTSPEIDTAQLLEHPAAAIAAVIENHPAFKAKQATAAAPSAETARLELLTAHSDGEQIWNSPDFAKWIGEHPGWAGIAFYGNQNNQGSLVASAITAYKEDTQTATPESQKTETTQAAMKAASVETKAGGTPVNSGKKQPVYRRADLLRLRMEDPERYDAMQPEIEKAYFEKRVI